MGRSPYAPDQPSRKAPARAIVGDMERHSGARLRAGGWPVVDAARRRSRRAPGASRARHALSADLPRLPSGDADLHGALCPRCWSAMRFIERPFCERLGTPFEQDLGQGLLSPQAMADPPVFARARAVARFEDGPARTLAHRLKYSDRAELARPIARWMARAGADMLADADLLAPVPLHPLRLWRRRFNQAAALARRRFRARPASLATGRAQRVKATRSQIGLSRAQRAENVQGAFRAAAGAAGARTQRRAGRRRFDLGRDRQRGLAGAPAGRRGAGRRAGFRPGCDRRLKFPYIRNGANPHAEGWFSRAADRHLHQVDLPLLPRGEGAAAATRRRRSRRSASTATAPPRRRWRRRRTAAGRCRRFSSARRHVGGCDDLHDLEAAGELDGLLAG